MLTIFVHSKVSKVVVNHVSKGTFVIIFWIRIRMWWRTLLRYFDQKIILFYAERGFWLFFKPQQVLTINIVPLGVHNYLHN